jgi:hypothetical protein
MAPLVSLHGPVLLFPIVRQWGLIIGKPSECFFFKVSGHSFSRGSEWMPGTWRVDRFVIQLNYK